MYSIDDFIQTVFSYTLQKQKFFAAAERALKKNLQSYIRPDFFGTSSGDVRLDNLLVSLANRLGEADVEDKRIFLEDAVSDFVSEEKADELRAILETKLERKHKIPEELADKFISKSGLLVDEEKKEFDRVKKDMVKLISGFIYGFFENKFKEFVRAKKKKEDIGREVAPDLEVLPDSELIDQAEKEQEWQEGLTKDLFGYINKNVPEKRRYAYKMILLKRFMVAPASRMGFVEMAEKTGIPKSSLEEWEKDLGRRLAEYLSAGGLGPKFVSEGGLYKKDVKVPDYKDVFKNKENSNDFKDFMEGKQPKTGKPMSEKVKKILELFAEGKDTKEIESQTDASIGQIKKLKSTHFSPWYKEWYAEMLKDVREATERIKKALMIINGETPPPASHEKYVNMAIAKKYPLELTVTFSANYDNQDLIKESDRVDPEKDPVDFKYKHYQVKLERTSRPRIEYTFDQKLTDKGDFEGSPRSSLVIEGNPGHEGLRRRLDEYVEQEMKPEGILPYGPSVKGRKPVQIPVEYVNESLDSTKTYDGSKKRRYRGFIDFADKYKGFMVKDQPHLTRVQEESKREEKKLLPKGGKNEIRKLIQHLKENIGDEMEETTPDKKKVEVWKKQIKELQDHLKKDSEKEIVDFVSKHKERFKFAVSEERMKNVRELMKLRELVENQEQRLLQRKMKGDPKDKDTVKLKEDIATNKDKITKLEKILEETKEPFPPPESAKVQKLLKELSDLGIKDRKLEEFLTSTDLQFFVNQVQGALAKEAQDNIAGVKKNKNMSDEEKKQEYEAIERKRGVKLNKFIELFEAVPEDMKKRLEKYKKADPSGYKKLEKKHGALLNWVNNPEKALSKVKQNLSTPKTLEAPKGKQESVVPMEEEDAKYMLNWLEAQLQGFDVIGERFGQAALKAEGLSPQERVKVEKQLKDTEKEFQDLRNRIGEMEGKGKATTSEIKDLKKDIPTYMRTIEGLKSSLSDSKESPAMIMAQVLTDRLSDFTKMYNPLSKTLWFSPKTYEKRAEIVTSEDDPALASLQKNIAKDTVSFSKLSIFDKESIRSLASTIRSGLSKFKKELPRMASFNPIYLTVEEKALMDKQAKEEDHFEKRVKFVFPEGELNDAKNMVTQLKEKKLDDASKKAQKELSELIKNVTSAYDDFDIGKIKALAEKEEISESKAAVRLKRIKDSLAKYALSQFILKWQDVIDMGFKDTPRKKGPLGGPESQKYDKILEIIEEDVPELFKEAPPEKEIKEAPKGLPTPKEIRERIEMEFEEGFPAQKEREYRTLKDKGHKLFKDPSGAGGGGGGKGKSRPKPIKKHPPAHTYETLKSNFKEALKTKSVHDIVLSEIGRYLHNVRNYVKGGSYFDVDDVVAGVVDVLKNFKKVIKSLRVTMDPGATADIKLKDEKEAKQLFNKLSDIYKLIDMIAADESGKPVIKIGPIPGDLSKIKTQRGEPDTWFPKGLMEAVQVKKREEIEEGAKEKAPEKSVSAKKVSAQFLAFKLAHKFSFSDLQKIEGLKEDIDKK